MHTLGLISEVVYTVSTQNLLDFYTIFLGSRQHFSTIYTISTQYLHDIYTSSRGYRHYSPHLSLLASSMKGLLSASVSSFQSAPSRLEISELCIWRPGRYIDIGVL